MLMKFEIVLYLLHLTIIYLKLWEFRCHSGLVELLLNKNISCLKCNLCLDQIFFTVEDQFNLVPRSFDLIQPRLQADKMQPIFKINGLRRSFQWIL